MKKFLSILLAIILIVAASVSMVGCGHHDNIVNDEKTINVKYRKQGYGTTFLTALARQFETTFASEGYKVNVLPPEGDLVSDKVMQDIYAGNKADLFFSDSFDAEKIYEGTYGQVAADITDSVWNKKPIKFDKSEEDKTVNEKLSSVFDVETILHNDKVYGIPYATPVGGLAVNTKVLNAYGFTELPRTTDEMFKCAEKLMETANEEGIFPFTYSFSNNLYINRVAAPWIAQAGGFDEHYKFFSWNNTDGTHMGKDKAHEVFGYDGVIDMLEVLFKYFDYNMMAYGCDSHDVGAAQGQIMQGKALFYATGDWMFQEEFKEYQENRNDVVLIPAPMISSLGEKLFGEQYPDKHDKILSEICKHANEGKLAEEIKPLVESALNVSLDLEDVLTVCERRGAVCNDVQIGAIVNVNSEKKDIASLFLRFIASTDAGKIFQAEAMTQSPYSTTTELVSEYQWFNGVNQMFSNPYFRQLKSSYGADYKSLLALSHAYFPQINYNFALEISAKNITRYDEENDLELKTGVTDQIYRDAAERFSEELVAGAKDKFEKGEWLPFKK